MAPWDRSFCLQVLCRSQVHSSYQACIVSSKKVLSSLVLYAWYRWLDGRFPARTGIVIAKKVLLDSAVLGMPLYSSFYLGERHFYRPELGEVTLGTS